MATAVMGFDTTDPDNVTTILDYFMASKGTAGSVGGTALSITTYMAASWDVGEEAKCLMYDSALNLLAQTEVLTTGGAGWHTFNFTGIQPAIVALGVYYFGPIGRWLVLGCYYSNDNESGGQGGLYGEEMPFLTPENPIVSWDIADTTSSILAYCTYKLTAGAILTLTGNMTISGRMICK